MERDMTINIQQPEAVNVAHLRALYDAATSGPWGYECEDSTETQFSVCTSHAEYAHKCVGETNREADARFIVHARNMFPAMLDEIERLRKHARSLTEALEYTVGTIDNVIPSLEAIDEDDETDDVLEALVPIRALIGAT